MDVTTSVKNIALIYIAVKDFGHCNQLSDRHATLFYDELSGQETIRINLFVTLVYDQ